MLKICSPGQNCMEYYENITDCNILHHFRMCSKTSFFSEKITFNVYRDCALAGILFEIIATIIVTCVTVVGNLFIPIVIWRHRANMWNSYGLCKLWLSICDIIMGVSFLPVRALIMVQVLFRAQHYPHSVIHEAKHLLTQITNSVLESQFHHHERPNMTYGRNYTYAPENATSLNLQTLIKAYEIHNRCFIVWLCCLIATYILTATWVLAIMSVDRQIAIIHPFFYQRHASVKRTRTALIVATIVSVLIGTVWPVLNLKVFHPSINNRFGLGASFLFGKSSIARSREIIVYYLTWLVPLVLVVGCNAYTACYCLFVMPNMGKQNTGHQISAVLARTLTSRWRRTAGQAIFPNSFNRRHTVTPQPASEMVAEAVTATDRAIQSSHVEINGRSGNNRRPSARRLTQRQPTTVSLPGIDEDPEQCSYQTAGARRKTKLRQTSIDVHQRNETLEAFWTLVLMTFVFLLTMTTAFVFTAFVPVPCGESALWTWIYAIVIFFFLNTPCQHIVLYNLKSPRFRKGVKKVVREAWASLRPS